MCFWNKIHFLETFTDEAWVLKDINEMLGKA